MGVRFVTSCHCSTNVGTLVIDTIASYLVQVGVWPGLGRFRSEYADLGEIAAGVLAASLISYLRAEYGPEAITSLWLDGPAKFSASLGMDLERLEANWRRHLDQVADPMSEADWERIDAEGCG